MSKLLRRLEKLGEVADSKPRAPQTDNLTQVEEIVLRVLAEAAEDGAPGLIRTADVQRRAGLVYSIYDTLYWFRRHKLVYQRRPDKVHRMSHWQITPEGFALARGLITKLTDEQFARLQLPKEIPE